MADIADMCVMGGSDLSGGVPMGAIEDISKSSLDKLPMPQQPAMVHGTAMAGHDLGAPTTWAMEAMK